VGSTNLVCPASMKHQLVCVWFGMTGHMLVSWLLTSFNSQHNVCQRVSQRDLRLIAIQLCTHLLAAHVVRMLEDDSANPSVIFKVCCVLTGLTVCRS